MHKILLIAIIISLASKKSCNAQDNGNGIDKVFRNYIDSDTSYLYYTRTLLVIINYYCTKKAQLFRLRFGD